MITRRLVLPVLAVASAVVALAVAPPATATSPQQATVHATTSSRAVTAHAAPHVSAKAIVCTATVPIGTTSACAIPSGGGTARYRFSVPAADTIRLRVATPDAYVDYGATLSKLDGTVLCDSTLYGEFDCAVPAGGTYRVDVVVDVAVTVYTTVDAVLAGACPGTVDLTVGAPGADVDVPQPGASWCGQLTDAPAGSVLNMALDVNGDQAVDLSVYDSTGVLLCSATLVTAFVRSRCSFGSGGAGYRVFVTPSDETAQDAVLILTRVSHPSGCLTRAPDAFGVPASRHATLAPHQQACFRFAGDANDNAGVHVFGVSGPTGTLAWNVRNDAGGELCNGTAADTTLTACALPSDGRYTLFVSSLARENVRALVSLVDLSSDAGCTAMDSTAWDAGSLAGTLSGAGQVDCHTFDAGANDPIRAAVFGGASGLLTTAHGAMVCDFTPLKECTVPQSVSYRAIISAAVRTPVAYRLWTIDTATTAGCTATTSDPFGVAPTRTADLDSDTLAVCYTFSAPADSVYYPVTEAATGFPFAATEIRKPDRRYCYQQSICKLADAGTYLLIVYRSNSGDDPVVDHGNAAVGLYRVDAADGCSAIATSFTGPPTSGDLAAPAQADCNLISGAPGSTVLVATDPANYQVVSQVFDRNGNPSCFAVFNTCRLGGAGPFRLVTVAANASDQPYRLRVASLTAQQGCTSLPATAFGRAPARAFAIDDPLDLRCYRINVPTDNGEIGVRTVGVDPAVQRPSVRLYTPTGSGGCTVSEEFGECAVSAAGQYLLVANGTDPASGTLGWYDLTSNAGCTPGPSLAFGDPPTLSRIPARGAVACQTVSLQAKDRVRFTFGPSAPGASFQAWLLEHTGRESCEFDSDDSFPANCSVRASEPPGGRVILWADDDASVVTGPVRLHGWRLINPTGCTDIGSLHGGFGPLVGQLADKNDEACYLARGKPGTLAVTTSNDDVADDVPAVQFVRATGVITCGVQGSGSCGLVGATYAVLVMRGSRVQDVDFAGHYRVEGTCTAGVCGP